MSENEYLEKTKFISALGLGLHQGGASSYRIEKHLVNVCELLGIHGSFLHTPTSFTFCFWCEDPTDQHIHIERMQPSEGDLGRLEMLDSLVERFAADELSFAAMREELEKVMATPPFYNRWLNCLAWVILSASFSALLSDHVADAVVTGLVTVIVFFLAQAAGRSDRIANTLEILAPMVSGVIVTAVAAAGVPINVPFVILSTVIAFIPGLSLTVALNEIANRDLVSGTSKFVHSVMALFKLYFGAILGVKLGHLLWGAAANDTGVVIHHLPEWRTIPVVLLLSLGLTIVFNIRLKQALWGLLAALVAYFVSQYGEAYFGVAAGMFLGAFAVGVYSNLYANLSNKPASLVLTQGLILLVPGSKTYILLDAWIRGEVMLEKSVQNNQAFLIFISLVVGLLFANAVLPTRKSL